MRPAPGPGCLGLAEWHDFCARSLDFDPRSHLVRSLFCVMIHKRLISNCPTEKSPKSCKRALRARTRSPELSPMHRTSPPAHHRHDHRTITTAPRWSYALSPCIRFPRKHGRSCFSVECTQRVFRRTPPPHRTPHCAPESAGMSYVATSLGYARLSRTRTNASVLFCEALRKGARRRSGCRRVHR